MEIKGGNQMKLYMITLGGKIEGCKVEIHDVQFAVAESIDDTLGLLRNNWYGRKDKLHMDSYMTLQGADGYKVQLTDEKPEDMNKLYFIYLGGYDSSRTQELHRVVFYVVKSEEEARQKAKKEMEKYMPGGHVDHAVDVGECLLHEMDEPVYLKFIKSEENYHVKPDWYGYRNLAK